MSDSMAARMAKLRLEAVNAFEATDYALAIAKIDAMRIIYDTTPDQEKDGLRINWRSIESLSKRIETLQLRASGAGKLQRVPITNGTVSGDYDE